MRALDRKRDSKREKEIESERGLAERDRETERDR